MTENEAIIYHKLTMKAYKEKFGDDPKVMEWYKTSIKALEEVQQYRAIGTVEECREAKEKQKPKIPDIWGDGFDNEGNMIYDMYTCPNCGEIYEVDYQEYKYCPECGQAMSEAKNYK